MTFIPPYIYLWILLLVFIFNYPAKSQDVRDNHEMNKTDSAIHVLWWNKEINAEQVPEYFLQKASPVYLAFRSNGERLYHLWVFPEDAAADARIIDLLKTGFEKVANELRERSELITTIEAEFTHSFQPVDYQDDYNLLTANNRIGVFGFQVRHGAKRKIYAPIWQLASNRRTDKQLALVQQEWKMSADEFSGADFSIFKTDQFLIFLNEKQTKALKIFRGNKIVDISEVSAQNVKILVDGMAGWMLNNLHPDGRMTYKYWPTLEIESISNNMIRQWMATNALLSMAEYFQKDTLDFLAGQNIDYNLSKFYHEVEQDGKQYGLIEWSAKVKLGALALAGLAILRHPDKNRWSSQFALIQNTINSLWHQDGSFTSFFKGPDYNYDNFYPGEAMLFWAHLYEETKDADLLKKYKASFTYYKNWHLVPENTNPAFIPWHIQANYIMWNALDDNEKLFKEELVNFNFQMADWLLKGQQWNNKEVDFPDLKGRFYWPGNKYGPPHSSSTGVYVEGLADAWKIAKELEDEERMNSYGTVIVRAVRSIMQLQFYDEIDMYYVSDKSRVFGGIRETVYDNEIRVDNVQHPLMGIMKTMKAFNEKDFLKYSSLSL